MKLRFLKRCLTAGTVLVAMAMSAQGATVSGIYGLNATGGPYATGLSQLSNLGSSTIGPAVELSYVSPYNMFDFTTTGGTLAFNIGTSSAYSFLGFVFTFSGLSGPLNGVTLDRKSVV